MNCPSRRILFAILAPLAVLSVPLAASASSGVEFVQLRVEQGSDSVRIEMPTKALEYVIGHSKDDIDVGKVNGREVRFPAEDLMKIVRGGSAKGKEVLFFTAKEAGEETARFFVKTEVRKAPGGKKPTRLAFSISEKSGEDSVRLSISLDTLESFVRDYGKDEGGKASSGDFGPLVRACLKEAKKLGPGPVLRIVGRDGEISFELE